MQKFFSYSGREGFVLHDTLKEARENSDYALSLYGRAGVSALDHLDRCCYGELSGWMEHRSPSTSEGPALVMKTAQEDQSDD